MELASTHRDAFEDLGSNFVNGKFQSNFSMLKEGFKTRRILMYLRITGKLETWARYVEDTYIAVHKVQGIGLERK